MNDKSCAFARRNSWIAGGCCDSEKCAVISGERLAIDLWRAEVTFWYRRRGADSMDRGRLKACCNCWQRGGRRLADRANLLAANGFGRRESRLAADNRPRRLLCVPFRERVLPSPCQA